MWMTLCLVNQGDRVPRVWSGQGQRSSTSLTSCAYWERSGELKDTRHRLGYSSVGRALALCAQGPEFFPSTKKIKKKKDMGHL